MTDLDEQGRPEPPLAGDETATLLGFLEYQRETFAWKCAGLDAAGLAALSRSAVAEAMADGGLARLARRTWPDGRAPSLRWILCHMVEEYARHNGHADLIRESVDGLTGE